MKSLIEQFINLGHQPYLISTNGKSNIEKELDRYLYEDEKSLQKICPEPDIDLCYTLPRNFKSRFQKESKLRLAIYNYESSHVPEEWIKCHQHIDYLLPSSKFSKEIFVKNGYPEEKCIVVPHGINHSDFFRKDKVPLKNDRSFQFLNVSIPHYRKNIDLLVDGRR
jgi:glycosyltransferase involved in cell wall biosynthesis